MNFYADFHTHTYYSRNNHGKGSIEENAEAAIAKGLRELWITDHGSGHLFFGIDRKKYQEIRSEIDRLNNKYKGQLKISFGVEANVASYDGIIDVLPEEMIYLDHINVGFHYGIIPWDFSSIINFMILNPLAHMTGLGKERMRQKNTDALIRIIKNYPIDVITHPGDKVRLDMSRLAKACARYGTALEINSSHAHLNLEEILSVMDTGVDFVVGSDAHSPKSVGDFRAGIERVLIAGLPADRIRNTEEYLCKSQ